jgi:flagellar hook-length control protein FliK
VKGPEEPSERPPLRVSGGRHAEGAPEKDLRAAPTGKPAERVVLVDLPAMPDVPQKAAPAVEQSSKGEEAARTKGAEGTPEPPAAQPTHTGAASISREVSEPIAGRQSSVGVQVHAVKESGSDAVNDGHGVSGKTHVRLTDELSRSMLDQVVKHVALQVRGGMSEMRIRLDPPSLGEMQVTVRVDEGRMQAQIDVSQPAVRVALETSVPQLRQTLADHGIEVHRIDIFASGSSMSQESSEGHGHRPRKRDGGRPQGSLDGVEQYRGTRMMGYNTIEMVM